MTLAFKNTLVAVSSLVLLALAGVLYALSAGEPSRAIGFAAALAVTLLTFAVVMGEALRFRRTDRELRELREQFQLIAGGLADSSLVMLAANGAITYWSPSSERMQGFGEKEALGKQYAALFPEEDVCRGRLAASLKTAAEDGRCEYVGCLLRKDGSLMQTHNVIVPIKDHRNGLKGFSVVTRDVTEQKRSEELLKKLALTVEHAADLVAITDSSGRVEYANKAVEDVTGYSRDEFFSGGVWLIHAAAHGLDRYRALWEQALAGKTSREEVTAIGKNGELLYLDETVTPIKDGAGNVTHVVFTGSDLTSVKLLRDKIDYLASYDSLTGLPNRERFGDRLNRSLAEVGAVRKPLAVLAIDIDRFKYLNEIYGLEAGNHVLKQVAESLSVSVNKGDLVGRLGSDEFGIVLHGVDRPAEAVLFVKMIMKNIPRIVMSGGEEISVTLAVGIAVHPADGTDARTLMKNADTALSRAKDLGRNRYRFYTPDMNVGISEIVFMERRLTDALLNKEYILSFQPYYHLAAKKVAGAEALIKWSNEEFGVVSPAKFIPMLEETGMIIDVGTWVLKSTCRQIKAWSNGKSRLSLSVNLSPSQFRHEYLVETVSNAIQELGIDPWRLTLEVTESVFMQDQDFAISVLHRLKNLGVSISIDDFGTGYSSLSYLKKFPVDAIKIDQSFIRDVTTDPDATSLVSSIISMAHGLNLTVIAEGVETEEQWKLLRLLKCDMAQGFYFSPAVLPIEFEKLLV